MVVILTPNGRSNGKPLHKLVQSWTVILVSQTVSCFGIQNEVL